MTELSNESIRHDREAVFAKHATAYQAARKHARACRKCFVPIIDEEGNPGYFGEACKKGASILKAYLEAENALIDVLPYPTPSQTREA